MLPLQPTKVGKSVFFAEKNVLCRAAISKWIGISERRLAAHKRIECGYIVCKYSDDRWSNSGETFAYFCTFVKKNCKHGHISGLLYQNKLDQSALIGMWVGMINLIFVLRSLKGRCYGNQLIWDTFCKHRN